MSEYKSPGVYVEKIEVGAKTIQGVETSTVGMVGLTQKGPMNKPTLITSNLEFQNVFGGYLDNSYGDYRYLPHAIEGFFQNGGQRVYINRVATSNGGVCDENIIGVCAQEPGKSTGLCTFKDIADIKILAIPNGTTKKIQNAMIAHCEQMKNRFAVLDPKKGATTNEIQNQRSLLNSKYAALYYPWIKIRIPPIGEILVIPPSGHISGVYVRTDMQQGVHKAPANATVEGVLSTDQLITKGQQDILNPLGVNCLREFSGRDLRVWGARTTSNDPLWKYINVRRLFLYLEESIQKGTQWVVFEPNNEKLWTKVKQTTINFLITVWKSGALLGATQEQVFFVKCDKTTMTQDDIDKGRLIALIGVAPTKPGEFIIFRIAQMQGGSTATE
jgi:phage tail sheath protein FI